MSFWKNFARYGLMAAPYVAAPFTGGSSLMMAGIGAGAGAGSALAGGGDMKDALIAGGMGCDSRRNRRAQQGRTGGASGWRVWWLSTLQPGGLAQMQGEPFSPAPPPGYAAPAQAAPRQPSVWSRMARNPETWQAAAQMIAGATEAASRNRSSLGDVQRASYVASGGQAYTPPAGTPTYGFGPQQTTGKLQKRASELEDELMKRLTPSFWERFGTFAAPAAGIYSTTQKK